MDALQVRLRLGHLGLGQPALEDGPAEQRADVPVRHGAAQRRAHFGGARRHRHRRPQRPADRPDGLLLLLLLPVVDRQIRPACQCFAQQGLQRLVLVLHRRRVFVDDIEVGRANDASGLVEQHLAAIIAVASRDQRHFSVGDARVRLDEVNLGPHAGTHEPLDLRQVFVLVVQRLLRDADQRLLRQRLEVRPAHREHDLHVGRLLHRLLRLTGRLRGADAVARLAKVVDQLRRRDAVVEEIVGRRQRRHRMRGNHGARPRREVPGRPLVLHGPRDLRQVARVRRADPALGRGNRSAGDGQLRLVRARGAFDVGKVNDAGSFGRNRIRDAILRQRRQGQAGQQSADKQPAADAGKMPTSRKSGFHEDIHATVPMLRSAARSAPGCSLLSVSAAGAVVERTGFLARFAAARLGHGGRMIRAPRGLVDLRIAAACRPRRFLRECRVARRCQGQARLRRSEADCPFTTGGSGLCRCSAVGGRCQPRSTYAKAVMSWNFGAGYGDRTRNIQLGKLLNGQNGC